MKEILKLEVIAYEHGDGMSENAKGALTKFR
jgi:hypothetical protein